VRVVGVAIRGDRAIVAQIMNADSYPSAYEIETAMCHRTGDGWEEGSSGNYNMTFLPTSDDRCTVVWWDEVPEGVTGARIRLGEQEQEVRVEERFFFVVFDDVPWDACHSMWLRFPPGASGFARKRRAGEKPRKLDWFHERPTVAGWIPASGDGSA